ncbi:hypothetical protein AB0K02_23560 [Streptomyces sp. NPDC049597]|uniref:hypothetical protein n=1 Tax=Streptomyces sp. NPDC049597 TaxID=3155276 RepID=UPI0034161EB2
MLIFVVLILAIRGTDLQFINSDKKYVAATAFLFGMMAMAAGKSWADLVKGVHDLPASVVVNGPMGDPGTGIATLVFLLLAFGPGWRKLWIPAIFGIAAGVSAGNAGGYIGVVTEMVRTSVLSMADAS